MIVGTIIIASSEEVEKSKLFKIGIRYEKVFPLPVSEMTKQFSFFSRRGIAFS